MNLARNSIGNLDTGTFSKLKNLRYLNLSDIGLNEIKLGLFSHTRYLRILDLSKNHLEIFDFELFLPKYIHLQQLYLNKNHLKELQGFDSALIQNSLPSLNLLGLTGNYFNCTYSKTIWLTVITPRGIRPEIITEDEMQDSPYEANINGIKCELIDSQSNRSVSSKVQIYSYSMKKDE